MILGGHARLLTEGAVPGLLHVVPVGDNATFDRLIPFLVQVSSSTYTGVLLAHAHHEALVSEASNNGGVCELGA